MSQAVLSAVGIEKSFGDRRILRGADLVVAPGERVGLVGVNGCGKSTLLRVIAGQIEADFGEVRRRGQVAFLEQDPALPGRTVGEAADEALSWHHELVEQYAAAGAREDLRAVARLTDRLDAVGWTLDHRVDALLEQLDAPGRERLVSELSGGEQRRVALVRALLGSPDLLLLDEPTNHLDAETAEWLQAQLLDGKAGVVLVTHDRYLLEAVATRIVEVDDGVCVSYDGSYADYLVQRAERRAQQRRAEDSRLAYIAREAEWASRSPAARSTKQKARLQRLDQLREARPLKREEGFELDLRTGFKAGGTILDLRGVSKGYGERLLVDELDLGLVQRDRLAILGPNGAGKSTLLRLITGEELPDAGTIQRGGRIRLGILDQERSGLDDRDTVFEAAANGASHVTLGDHDVHVVGFLRRFLFPRESLDQPVSTLSGGERARLLLARLLLEGCNLLLLDEPTNDLDLLTLRVLEEALLSFDGTVVVVSHDRAFVDRVSTAVLAFEGDGEVVRYADRLQAHRAAEHRRAAAAAARKRAPRKVEAPRPKAPRGDRLSWKEERELEALPGQIEELEQEQAAVEAALGDPSLYRDRGDEVPALTARLQALEQELPRLYERWEDLEARG